MNTCPACGTPPVPGFVTVTPAVPDLPSLVARIVAVPALTAVTSPLALTVATAAESDDQVIVRPLNVRPAGEDVPGRVPERGSEVQRVAHPNAGRARGHRD